MSIEAMKKAMAALESCAPADTSSGHVIYPSFDEKLVDQACEALRTAIQQAEAKTDEPVDFPAGAIVNGRTLIERIEAYPFESQGGGLRMCSDWHELRRCFEHLADYVSAHPAQGVPDIEAAAKKLAECMDYPWEHMPEKGRANMRKHAASVLTAAQAQKGGE